MLIAPPSAQGRPSVYTKIFEPNIYLYDKYPGGIGFSEPLFRLSPNLLENTRRLIVNCPCESGCPSCVGPVGEVGEKGKEVALAILPVFWVRNKDGLFRAGADAGLWCLRARVAPPSRRHF